MIEASRRDERRVRPYVTESDMCKQQSLQQKLANSIQNKPRCCVNSSQHRLFSFPNFEASTYNSCPTELGPSHSVACSQILWSMSEVSGHDTSPKETAENGKSRRKDVASAGRRHSHSHCLSHRQLAGHSCRQLDQAKK